MFPKWEPHPFPFGNLCLILTFLASQDPLEVSTSVSESYLADLTGVTLASEDTKDSWRFAFGNIFSGRLNFFIPQCYLKNSKHIPI